jgi:hypothetical protein
LAWQHVAATGCAGKQTCDNVSSTIFKTSKKERKKERKKRKKENIHIWVEFSPEHHNKTQQ